tara:strand:- start:835 stop:1617 length:783 start_codon:yes stop_codon:yes gene_type:complete
MIAKIEKLPKKKTEKIANYINSRRKLYIENGFVIYKNFITKSLANNIKKDLNIYLKKIKNKKFRLHLTKDNKINSIHGVKFKWVSKLQNYYYTKILTNNLLGEKPKKFGSELFAKPPRTGMKVPIHQDNYFWNTKNGNALTIWFALDNSNKKNGAIFYFKGSHKNGLVKHSVSFHPGTSQEIKKKIILDKYKKITPVLQKGDCIVHNSLTIHGSNENLSNKPRTGLTLRYIAKNEKFNSKLIKAYKKDLKKNDAYLKKIH